MKNKKVLIMGLGTKDGGVGSAIYFANLGANVVVTDLKNESDLISSLKKLKDYPIKYKLGGHDEKYFREADLVVKNPGIKHENKYLQIAHKNNVPITTPIEIFCNTFEKPYIGITGTKGKSLTTHLTNYLLQATGLDSVAAGNNCVSPLRFLGDKNKHFVLELSSWQLHEMGLIKKSPQVACFLNFFPDHMNYYQSQEDYFSDKMEVFNHQGSTDFAVLPESLYNHSFKTKTESIFVFSLKHKLKEPRNGAFLAGKKIMVQDDGNAMQIDTSGFVKMYPQYSTLLLASLLNVYCYLKKTDQINLFSHKVISQAINSYPGLEHRYEKVFHEGNFLVINDSSASTPESVILALQYTNQKPIVLIAGGGNPKNLDFARLSENICSKCHHVILFKNDVTSDILHEKLSEKVGITKVSTLEEAVETGIQILKQKGFGTLLLSPGCSGAPFFTDMFERGNLFKTYVLEKLTIQNP